MDRFEHRLYHQLDFLDTSAQMFDQGRGWEAQRISLSIRLLLNDTFNKKTGKPSQVSLLTHLNARDIQLLSTCSLAFFGEKPKYTVAYDGMGFANGRPLLGHSFYRNFISVEDWWKQILLISGEVVYTRRDCALVMAERDGGAHVDAVLPADYENLMEKGLYIASAVEADGQRASVPLIAPPVFAMRQMAYELLNSPDLMALAGLKPASHFFPGGVPVPDRGAPRQPEDAAT